MYGLDRVRRSARAHPRVVRALTAFVAVLFVVLAIAVWWFGESLEDGVLVPDHSPDDFDLRVVAVDADTITLQGSPDGDDWITVGIWGLEAETGYGRLGPIVSRDGETVVREFELLTGSVDTGDAGRVDSFAFPPDPTGATGRAYSVVTIDGSAGPLPTWFVPGSGDTWIIFVHGKDSERTEGLRLTSSIADLDVPMLFITYRGDPESEVGGAHRYSYGRDEWPDLGAAASHALDSGAREVIIVGYSMGGAITTRFLLEADLATCVAGLILDAPLLDLGETVSFAAGERGIPGFLTTIVKWTASWRFGVDWTDADYRRRADELVTPMLVIHGDADKRVPVATSRALAEARPDLVTLVEVPDADHVRSWNVDREAYGMAVRRFLTALMPVETPCNS